MYFNDIAYAENYYMEEAIKEARKAYKKNEVPVGAIIVKERTNNCKST